MSSSNETAGQGGVKPEISLIVPTINESENLPILLKRVAAALAGRKFEVIIVDDNSKDRTPEVCAELAKTYPLTLMVRTTPTNGLSGAVLHGMARAQGTYFCVMDADLQHPPEKLPELVAPLISGQGDFVVGSRYTAGGTTETEWGLFRSLNSKVATLLARPFAGKITDPMSGFFALSRESYLSARNLTPLGYKIALELMCKARVTKPMEIPIHFAMREKGESKLSLKQQFRYLEHLSRLYDFTFPRFSPVIKFLIATGLCWLVGLGVYCSVRKTDLGPIQMIGVAYAAVIIFSAIFHVRYVKTQREFLARQTPWFDFLLISAAEWAAAVSTTCWLTRRVLWPNPCEIFVIAFGAATLMRYILRKEFLQDIRGLRKNLPGERTQD